jgi:hypothetical protein
MNIGSEHKRDPAF